MIQRTAYAWLLLIALLAGCGGQLQEPGGPVDEPTESAPIETITGTWEGTITSSVYNETESVTLTIDPPTEVGNHPADLEGQLLYCELEESEMTCYIFGTRTSIYMLGNVEGRTWTGEFAFDSDTYGPDSGTFTFTKR